MLKKRKARELAMQVLFLWDTNGASDAALAAQVAEDGPPDVETRRDGLKMAAEAWNARQTADQWIVRLAPQWPPLRQAGVDRNILRLAGWDIKSVLTTPKVVVA